MRRTFGLGLVWVLVTTTAIVVTSAAVGNVRSNVTDTVAAPFRVEQQVAALDDGPSVVPRTTGDDEPVVRPPGTTSPDLLETVGPTTRAPTSSVPAPTTAATTPPPPASPSTTSPPATTGTPNTTTPTAPTAQTVVKTYTVVGGSVTVEIGSSSITLLGAVPNSGFSAEEDNRDDPTKVRVEFDSEFHESKISIEFENGQVVTDIDEDPKDD